MSVTTYGLTDVSLRLGRRSVLTNLTLSLEGRCIGLLGSNGAGKTSLLRLLATVLRPDRGRILLHGHDIVKSPAYARTRIGYVPQHFHPSGDLTGRQVLQYLGTLRQVSQLNQEVESCLEQTGLTRVAHQATGTYSGGMLRRLALAQALLTKPAVLLLDEPTAGLDPEERDRFRNLIGTWSARGHQVVISTHLLEDVSAVADKVVVIHDGRLLFAGPTESLIDREHGGGLDQAYLCLLRGASLQAGEGG